MKLAVFLVIISFVRWVQDKNLAGVCIDSVDKDDSTGKCLKQKWPYLTTVSNQLKSKPVDRSGGKKDECNFTGKMADEKDCYIYYECKSGTKMKAKCKHGSVFNSKTNRCDWNLSLLKCQQIKALVGETTTPLGTKTKVTGVTTARSITKKTTTARTTIRTTLKPITRTMFKPKTWTTLKPSIRVTPKITARTTTLRVTTRTPKTSARTIVTTTEKNDVKGVFGNSKNSYKLLCYITNWSFNRKVKKFDPEDLDQDLCTHNVYAYAYLDPKKLIIKESNSNIDLKLGFYKRTTSLKKPTLLAVGGWTDSQTTQNSINKYSKLIENKNNRNNFIDDSIKYLNKYGFKGIVIEWLYPKSLKDKDNFVLFVNELSEKFKMQTPPLIVGVTISGYKDIVTEAYDVAKLSKNADFLNVLTIDYHGKWENETFHPTSIYKQQHDKHPDYNINHMMEYLIEKNVPKNKLIMTVPLYGHSFRLKSPNDYKLGAPAEANPQMSDVTLQKGVLSYAEICEMIENKTISLNNKQSTSELLPFAFNKQIWVGFDNVDSLKSKVKYLTSSHLGGISAWSVDLDDFANDCCQQPFPLLRTLSSELGLSRKQVNRPGSNCKTKVRFNNTTVNNYHKVAISTQSPYSRKPSYSKTTTKYDVSLTTVTSIEGRRCTTTYQKHETDCTRYYHCLNNAYITRQCPNGLHWNSNYNVCDHARNAKCSTNTSMASENDVGSNLCKQDDKPIHPLGCTKYLICLNNQAHIRNCADGKVFDPNGCECVKSNKCIFKDNVDFGDTVSKPIQTYTSSVDLDNEISTVAPSVDHGGYKIVCYFTNWAVYRPEPMDFKPEDIDYDKCTHIVYAFAILNEQTYTIQPHDTEKDIAGGFYEKVVKNKKPGTKVLIGIGGWNDSKGDKYSKLVNDPKKRAKFIEHVIGFLKEHHFDGLDLDWEYPKCWQVECERGPDSDKPAFTQFVIELRKEFNKHGYLLSAAVSPSLYVAPKAYDVKQLSENLDWIGVMNYDYHGIWERKTGHVAPLYPRQDDGAPSLNVHATITYYLDKNIDSRKLVLGLPFYGKSFTLNSKYNHGLNAGASRAGAQRKFTRAEGTMAFYEICKEIQDGKFSVVKDPKHRHGPYAYNDDEWISYDDEEIISKKIDYVKKLKLGGSMIWALDFDDFRNVCGHGKNPLLTAVYNSVHGIAQSTTPTLTTQSYHKPTQSVSTNTGTTTMSTHGQQPSKDDQFKVVCYFTNWSWYRQGVGKFLPEHIDPELCTHIVYAFAVLNGNDFVIKSHDSWADVDNNFYQRVVDMKKKGTKVLIGLGGWNDSAGSKYSDLVNNLKRRKQFNDSLLKFIQKYDFDGVDLDWEYPKCWQVDCSKGPDSDKEAFSQWVQELHKLLKPHGYLLSAAVSPAKKVIDGGYDVPVLSTYLDWIAVMCYDYFGKWDKATGHVAPLYKTPGYDETFNADFSINYWIQKGADPRKIVMGMPTYGRSFTLVDEQKHSFLSPTTGGAEAGEFTRESGFLSYYEICMNVGKRGWTVFHDEKNRSGPYAYHGNQWVGFDNGEMIRTKSNYVIKNNLGGAMVWAVDLDDFNNVCQCESYPLLKIINRVLRNYDKDNKDFGCKLSSVPFDENHLFTTTKGTTQWSWSQAQTSMTWWSQRPTTSKPMSTNQIAQSSMSSSCSYSESFKSHESNCNKYYQCVHDRWVQQTCPNGLHWSGSQCDWPNSAKCKH